MGCGKMKYKRLLILSVVAFASSVWADLNVSQRRLELIKSPPALEYSNAGKTVVFKPHPDKILVVLRGSKPLSETYFYQLVDATKAPSLKPLYTVKSGNPDEEVVFYSVEKTSLMPQANLEAFAKKNELPMFDPLYLYDEEIVLNQGNLAFKLQKDADIGEVTALLLEQLSPNPLTIKRGGGFYRVFTELSFSEVVFITNELQKLKSIKWAEPDLIVRVRR
jgi:hypothetical protein